MSQATISLCMIVRDAESTLGAALDSAKPFVDEMVIIDTGSVDKTVQVAEARGAKVYHFPWIDNFSAARNESIEKATGDWVFWMDADDVLVQSTGGELLRSVMENPNRDVGFMLRMEERKPDSHVMSQFLHLKLFPRHPDIRFQYRIHEKVEPSITRLGFKIKMCNATVQHANADRSPEANARRIKRNRPLLELELKENPCDGIVLFNVGYHYLICSQELQKATELLERSLAYLPKDNSLRLDAFQMLIKAYWRAKDGNRLAATCEAALENFPDASVFLLDLGRVKEIQGDDKTAEKHYLRALNHGRVTMTNVDAGNLETQIALHLGRIYKRTNRETEMELIWLKYLDKYPHDWKLHRALIEAYISSQRPDEAEKQLQLFPSNPETMSVRLALAGGIAVLRKDWVNAINNLTESRRMGVADPFQLYGLSIAFMATGRFTEAEAVLKQLLEIAPHNPHAIRNLKVIQKHLDKSDNLERGKL